MTLSCSNVSKTTDPNDEILSNMIHLLQHFTRQFLFLRIIFFSIQRPMDVNNGLMANPKNPLTHASMGYGFLGLESRKIK